jgi:HK97 gp10 family phage protein
MPVRTVFNLFPALAGRIEDAAASEVKKTGNQIKEHIQVSMNNSKHGRVYIRFGRQHVASAPGESPAVDLGNLANSVQFDMLGKTRGAVYTTVDYAEYLEFGTARMAARPAFGPAADFAFPQLVDALRNLESLIR